MAGRDWARIHTTILRTKKIRQLAALDCWVLICAHITSFSSYSAIHQYPMGLWAIDAKTDFDGLTGSINKLVQVGLLEVDFDEELLRVVGFQRDFPPENASYLIGVLKDFEKLLERHSDCTGMILRGAAEFSVAAIARSRDWKDGSTDAQKVRSNISAFFRDRLMGESELALALLNAEIGVGNTAIQKEFESFMPELAFHRQQTVSTPCPDPVDTQEKDKTNTKQKETNQDQTTDRNTDVTSAAANAGPLNATKESRVAKEAISLLAQQKVTREKD